MIEASLVGLGAHRQGIHHAERYSDSRRDYAKSAEAGYQLLFVIIRPGYGACCRDRCGPPPDAATRLARVTVSAQISLSKIGTRKSAGHASRETAIVSQDGSHLPVTFARLSSTASVSGSPGASTRSQRAAVSRSSVFASVRRPPE